MMNDDSIVVEAPAVFILIDLFPISIFPFAYRRRPYEDDTLHNSLTQKP